LESGEQALQQPAATPRCRKRDGPKVQTLTDPAVWWWLTWGELVLIGSDWESQPAAAGFCTAPLQSHARRVPRAGDLSPHPRTDSSQTLYS